jgi:hypothetical protein
MPEWLKTGARKIYERFHQEWHVKSEPSMKSKRIN